MRARGVHCARPWSQFARVNRELDAAVRDLTGPCDLGPGSRVLDYGCAGSPYRRLLPPGSTYVRADLPGNPLADVELTADGTVPLADASFDLVLSTQVLEHVVDPDVYLAECARLLRPGGALVLSTHGIMYYHRDPEDYWRWTMVGLARVVERHGLDVVDRRGVLGLAATGLQLFQDATYWKVPALLRRPYALLLQSFVTAADRRCTPAEREDNGLVIAVRAVRPAAG